MNSLMTSCIDASTLLVRIGATQVDMLAFTTKSISSLITNSFFVFEPKVEFNKTFLPPRLFRGQFRLAEEVKDDTVVGFHYEC